MDDYNKCSECNYRFLTQNDPYCRKCGEINPRYSRKNVESHEIIELISKINDNINSCAVELSLKMEKIEEQLRVLAK